MERGHSVAWVVLIRRWLEPWRSRIVVILLIVTAALWLLPIIYMVSVSFRVPWEVFEPAIISTSFTTGNYEQIFADNPLPRHFLNSIVVSVTSTALVVAGATLFAFAVSILKVRGGAIVYATVLLTLMVPIAALVVPVAQELKQLGWTNTWLGLIGPYTALGIPFATVILVAVMDDLPKEDPGGRRHRWVWAPGPSAACRRAHDQAVADLRDHLDVHHDLERVLPGACGDDRRVDEDDSARSPTVLGRLSEQPSSALRYPHARRAPARSSSTQSCNAGSWQACSKGR